MYSKVIVSHRPAGSIVQNYALFASAWDEFVELQVQPKDIWAGTAISSLSQLDRWEVFVHNGEVPVGAVVLASDPWDVHVGPCYSVFAQYVLPEYRNAGISLRLMREAVRICRTNSAPVLAYTHRAGDWTYLTRYRRIT